MQLERLRIQPVPAVQARCAVCAVQTHCTAYDHDLRGHVCEADRESTIIAEVALRLAGIAVPRHSIAEDGLAA